MTRIPISVAAVVLCGLGLLGCSDHPQGPSSDGNQAPVVTLLVAQPRFVAPGGECMVRCEAIDNEGAHITYSWYLNDEPVGGDQSTLQLTAPAVEGGHFIRVSVSDPEGATTSSTLEITVAPLPERVNAIVLRSHGGQYPSLWSSIDAEWSSYGTVPVQVDYTSFYRPGITYDEISASDADVLVIDDARNPLEHQVFSADEIAAIRRYVVEGHGLLVTGGTLRPFEHCPLAELLGYSDAVCGLVYYGLSHDDTLQVLDLDAELFEGLTSLLIPTTSHTLYSGYDWDNDWTWGYPDDWQVQTRDPHVQIPAHIWNYRTFETTQRREGSPISCYEAATYRAVFAGYFPGSSSDEVHLFYNVLVYVGRHR